MPFATNLADKPPVKLVIWDLDNTLWEGILLEGDKCAVSPRVRDVLIALDERGVLNSIASRNDHTSAMDHLNQQGLAEYFLVPQIGWGTKSESILRISTKLNISVDATLFVDDSEFELSEASFASPTLRTLNAANINDLMRLHALDKLVVTDEASRRRRMYLDDAARSAAEQDFVGPHDDFMASLNLILSIRRATAADLDRAEELTIRTNQLNSTGIGYSKDDLRRFISSTDHVLLVIELQDRFGNYGIIGVVLISLSGDAWTVKLILISCRVLSRGVGQLLLNYFSDRSNIAGRTLNVDFRDTGKNRAMKVALMIAGFTKASGEGNVVFTRRGGAVNQLPTWLKLDAAW